MRKAKDSRLREEALLEQSNFLRVKDNVLKENNLSDSAEMSRKLDAINTYAPTITQNPFILNSIVGELKGKGAMDVDTHHRISSIEKSVSDSARTLRQRNAPGLSEGFISNMGESLDRAGSVMSRAAGDSMAVSTGMVPPPEGGGQNEFERGRFQGRQEVIDQTEKAFNMDKKSSYNGSIAQRVMEKRAMFGNTKAVEAAIAQSTRRGMIASGLVSLGIAGAAGVFGHLSERRRASRLSAQGDLAFNKAMTEMQNQKKDGGDASKDLGNMDFTDKKTWERSRSYFDSLKRISPELAADPVMVKEFLTKTVPANQMDMQSLKMMSDLNRNITGDPSRSSPFLEGFKSNLGKSVAQKSVDSSLNLVSGLGGGSSDG